MSAVEPDLPKDPAAYRPRPLGGVTPWALVGFGVICVLAGAGVALMAPRLMPPKPAPGVVAVASAPSATAPAPVALPIEVASPTADEVARLQARIAVLESQGARSTEAAAAALAAAQLLDAAQGSKPFDRELSALRANVPDLPEFSALARLAQAGAPSRTALAASFPPYAAKAARRARKPGDSASLGERLAYAAAKIVTLRRIDETSGSSPDAILHRAELALQEGQVVAALKTLEALPPKAREALAPWREQAERRAEIDRQVTALRARAVRALQAPAA